MDMCEKPMRTLFFTAALIATATTACAKGENSERVIDSPMPAGAISENFDAMASGTLPKGWTCSVTGRGSPVWRVEADPSAPSEPNILKQSGNGDYPWCAKQDSSLSDGSVEVRFKPVSGRKDQAGGLIWRWQDGDNYYIARANALEDNVTIYRTVQGNRRQLKSAGMKVAPNQWHKLRVDFEGNKFTVILDGKLALEAMDETFQKAGAVGVWTKADSATEFDDFTFGGQRSAR